MCMKLYYGSKTLFQTPTYGEGNPTNDYGLGFYMTKDYEMARLWATQYENGGYVLSFNVDFDGLEVLNLLDSDEVSILKWIALLVSNRFDYKEKANNEVVIEWLTNHFYTPLGNYDVIAGYRADDSYFKYSLGFVTGQISLETLAKAMKIGKLGYQYVLMSKKAFKQIEYVDSKQIEHSDEYQNFRMKASDEYNELLKQENIYTNTYIRDLMRKYGK